MAASRMRMLADRGGLKLRDLKLLFEENMSDELESTNQQLFNDYLRKINKELSFVQLELRACRNQYNSSVYYGVVNNVADEQSKLGTKYTVPQIGFYKGIIEAIVQDATVKGSISNIDALNIRLDNQVQTGAGSQQDTPANIPPAFKNFSLSQKEKTLEELVRDQWLCSTPDGNIGLGLRSFLDLRSWFRNNDIPACEVCNEAGIKVEKVCSGCGTPWLLPVPKTEAVEEEEDDTNGPTQSKPPPGPSTRKRLRTSEAVDSGTIGSGSSQDPVPSSDSRRATRSSSRVR
ncbi:embryo defective 1379 [Actinidia rufa]|uniref:Non-structural maintenance of chromosomes element 1 homolog n=1 Tax=Actinidia rufa TaxID=165716 RepID=A0A7J0H5J0_9ERIC|nr:embryo defective 1379 [Actinidia rufa]